MSSDLIQQLKACAVKLGVCAETLQCKIREKRNKNKHYVSIIAEASILKQMFSSSCKTLVVFPHAVLQAWTNYSLPVCRSTRPAMLQRRGSTWPRRSSVLSTSRSRRPNQRPKRFMMRLRESLASLVVMAKPQPRSAYSRFEGQSTVRFPNCVDLGPGSVMVHKPSLRPGSVTFWVLQKCQHMQHSHMLTMVWGGQGLRCQLCQFQLQ